MSEQDLTETQSVSGVFQEGAVAPVSSEEELLRADAAAVEDDDLEDDEDEDDFEDEDEDEDEEDDEFDDED